MKQLIVKIVFCFMLTALVSCGSSAEELFETAEFEMLQTNYPHATKLYQEIIEKHPKSELAVKAKIRLEEIKAHTP